MSTLEPNYPYHSTHKHLKINYIEMVEVLIEEINKSLKETTPQVRNK